MFANTRIINTNARENSYPINCSNSIKPPSAIGFKPTYDYSCPAYVRTFSSD
jgi:hypothetical protein